MTETRMTSSTGGEKGQKLARFDLLPAEALWQVAELYGKGAEKYSERNWENGYEWNLSFAAMMRHASLFWQGEDIDPETGCPHMASVVFHALALMTFAKTHPEFDNRPEPATVIPLNQPEPPAWDLARIDAIAARAHAGQTRKYSGDPYITHPRRVADAVEGDHAKAVALLHDVLEDTNVTASELLQQGVPADVVADVMVLTHAPNENYWAYIDKIIDSGHRTALLVKEADIRDNLRDLPFTCESTHTRYKNALADIQWALDELEAA